MDTSTSGTEASVRNRSGEQISDGFIDTILKLSSENKFNEKNCWSFPIRDSLVFYQRRQDTNMSSLIKAGSLAEACTKIYGFRVDSVYNSVKSTYLRLKETDESQLATETDITDLAGEEEEQQPKKQKRVRKRKSDFVVKEKSSLLATIQTHPRGNMIIDNKNKRSNETNFVEGLLQNILQTRDYVLQLDPAAKFWDNQPLPPVPSSDNIDDNIEDYLDDVMGFNMPSLDTLKMTSICPSFRHFDVRIDSEDRGPAYTLAPSEKVVFDMDEPMMDIEVDDNRHFEDSNGGGGGGEGDGFTAVGQPDVPCSLGDHFNEHNITDADVERFIEKNGGWSDVQPDQYPAVKRYMVRMARNNRGTSGSSNGGIKFTDFYESYWAGPAYWKFKKARASVQPRETGQRKGRAKKDGDRPIEMVDVNTLKFVPIEYKNRELDPRKVDPKNVIMPRNLNISRTIITNLTHTPWMSIYDIMGKGVQTAPSLDGGGNSPGHYPEMNREGGAEDFAGWQNNNGADGHHHDDDASGGPMGDDMGADEMEHEDHLNVSHLSAHLDGAPQKSEPLILPYSKINKNIDMYELKQSSKRLISNRQKSSKKGDSKMTLQELFHDLPPELSKENAEYLSLAIAFSALLHVAHEESYYLKSVGDYENIEIVS